MYIKLLQSISEIDALQWNGLLDSEKGYPFLRHEFLAALEESGATTAKTGWTPQHCVVYSSDDESAELIAAMPLYEKRNSNGEYIFDHTWANAYLQNGFDYFPKWVTSIPFTPCEGTRLLISPAYERENIYPAILQFLIKRADDNNISSWHCLFAPKKEVDILRSQDLIIRESVQFRWTNKAYADFDHYLESFRLKKRKNVRRERRWVKDQNIEILQIEGTEITENQLQAFYSFYQMTYLKRNMPPYLELSFFQQLATTMPAQLLLIMAVKDGVYVGAALSLLGEDTLYGRYWGCYDEYNSLHFEACYYQGLEYCVDHQLQRFDSGAQGEHKISRGFEPVTTYSAHWIKNPKFNVAIDRYVQQETQHMSEYKVNAALLLPFKNSQSGT